MFFVPSGERLLGLFAVFGLMANGTYSDLEESCPNATCPPGHAGDISQGQMQQTIANVGLVVFVLGAAGAVTLWILSAPSKSTTTTTATTATSTPTAKVVARGSFLGLEGSF